MNLNYSNINFNGYANIIANSFRNDTKRVSLLCMQLNNSKTNDLEKYIELQKMQGIANPKDTLTSILIEDKLNKSILLFNEQLLADNRLLKKLDLSRNKAKSIEAQNLKGYTILANLTNSIMNNSISDKTSGISFVIKDSFEFLTKVFDSGTASKLVMNALNTKIEPNKVAYIINKYIDKTMRAYLE